jgi:ABC-type transporter Mla subunit MlaD
MALQDLTPQLRTRLSRMERAVGWFVMLALAVLVFGFAYYIYNAAERKGWFKTKAPYFTFTDRATGLKIGDPVQLMGLEVGQITRMEPMPPEIFAYNIYVEFEIKDPYYGYLWTDGSRAKVTTADFLGKRVLEVTKGTNGYPTYTFFPLQTVAIETARRLPPSWVLGEEILDSESTNLVGKPLQPLTNLNQIASLGFKSIVVLDTLEKRKVMTGIWNDQEGRYEPFTKKTKYWLISDESPAVTERLEKLVSEVEKALPNILNLTNQLTTVLSNGALLTSNLNVAATTARPAISNLALATAQLDRPGALGEWLLPTNVNRQLERTLESANRALDSANGTFTSANTNLAALVESLSRSLDNLSNLTSNLNTQVQANTNLVSAISKTIVDADQFVQGLKQHWLFRSAFKTKKQAEPGPTPAEPLRSPKESK